LRWGVPNGSGPRKAGPPRPHLVPQLGSLFRQADNRKPSVGFRPTRWGLNRRPPGGDKSPLSSLSPLAQEVGPCPPTSDLLPRAHQWQFPGAPDPCPGPAAPPFLACPVCGRGDSAISTPSPLACPRPMERSTCPRKRKRSHPGPPPGPTKTARETRPARPPPCRRAALDVRTDGGRVQPRWPGGGTEGGGVRLAENMAPGEPPAGEECPGTPGRRRLHQVVGEAGAWGGMGRSSTRPAHVRLKPPSWALKMILSGAHARRRTRAGPLSAARGGRARRPAATHPNIVQIYE